MFSICLGTRHLKFFRSWRSLSQSVNSELREGGKINRTLLLLSRCITKGTLESPFRPIVLQCTPEPLQTPPPDSTSSDKSLLGGLSWMGGGASAGVLCFPLERVQQSWEQESSRSSGVSPEMKGSQKHTDFLLLSHLSARSLWIFLPHPSIVRRNVTLGHFAK